MHVLGIELTVPTRARNIQAIRWLFSALLLLGFITAFTGGKMHDVPRAGLQWLPMVALWSWGWDPLRQGPPSWIVGVVAWTLSTIFAAFVVHFFKP